MLLDAAHFRRLCEARDLLASCPAPVPLVARRAGMSPFHFIRRFEELFGETPHQWRLRRRIDRARLLLAQGDLSVTEISLQAGFGSLSRFSQRFAAHTGTPPSEFRRQARSQVAMPGILPMRFFPGCLTLMAQIRNFGQASAAPIRLASGNANQAVHTHGGRSGKGAPLLYGRPWLSEET